MRAMTTRFDPDRLAKYEADGWRAYYDRRWPTLAAMTVRVCQERFGIPFPLSIKAAYHVTRASIAWVPVDHDIAQVREQLARFYRLAARYSGLIFTPGDVVEHELHYWDENRRLAGGNRDNEHLRLAMTRLHAALFGLTEAEAQESATWRARALVTLDRITSGASSDLDGNWQQITEELRQCYHSIGQLLADREEETAPMESASNDYHFITHWRVQGTVEEINDVLKDATDLPRWWPSVYLDVIEKAPGDEQGIGRVVKLYTKGWLPYTLRWQFTVTESRYPHGFTIRAMGDFDGRGIWTFAQEGESVTITYDWKIRADKPLLKYLSFLMKPLFSWNHRWAMSKGEESLKLELARRHARTAAERAAIPAPPAPTTTSVLPMLAGLAGITLAIAGLRRLVRN